MKLKKLFFTIMFLLFSFVALSEVPHSYVTENPEKEIQKVETLKEKEKAELNLSVEKIKSKEIQGKLDERNNQIIFSLPQEINGNVITVERLEDLPNSSTVQGKKILSKNLNNKPISNNLTQEIRGNNLIVDYKNKPERLYISDFKNFYKWKINSYFPQNLPEFYYTEGLGMLYYRNFDEEHRAGTDDVNDVNLKDIIFDSEKEYGKNTLIKKVSGINKVWTGHTQNRPSWFSVIIHGYNKEGKEVYNSGRVGRYDVGGYADSTAYTFPWDVTLQEHCRIVIQVWGHLGNPYHDNGGWDNTMDAVQVYDVELDDFIHKADGESNLVIEENYRPEYIKFNSCTMENLKPLSLANFVNGAKITSTTGDGLLHLDPTDILEINGQSHTLSSGNLSEQKLKLDKIDLSYKVENGKLQLKVDSYGLKVNSPQSIDIKITKNKDIKDIMEHRINLTVPYLEKVIGESILEVGEYYPTPEYIKFNSCTLSNPADIGLENNLKDVKLSQTLGKGLVALEQGNILELNGKKYTVGAGGNLAEQHDSIGTLNFKFKVENGKLRLALKSWGVLEPDRELKINAEKFDNTAIMEHTLTIKSPRKVEGTSDIKFDNNYQIRNFVRFQAISLTAPTILTLETPIPQGVSLKSQEGQGIPFMKENDILEINDGMTRAVHSYQIGAGGNLEKQQIKFNSSDITLYVENGKLRIGLNNWLVNKPVNLKFRIIRGTNEIMNHAITFDVPEAPFNIVENGLLDFGQVVAGSKREAETNIVLEMLKDVEEVKFSLRDPQPVMENLKTGDKLKVQEIQYLVRHQGDRRYMVKLHGKLNVPANQQSGEYSGTTVLELKIK